MTDGHCFNGINVAMTWQKWWLLIADENKHLKISNGRYDIHDRQICARPRTNHHHHFLFEISFPSLSDATFGFSIGA